MAKNEIVHVDFPAKDIIAAGKFYDALFGWRYTHYPKMQYVMFAAEHGPGGGFVEASSDRPIGEVLVHVETDDIDETLARAKSLGAQVLMPKTESPGIGWFATFADPSGNKVALYTGK